MDDMTDVKIAIVQIAHNIRIDVRIPTRRKNKTPALVDYVQTASVTALAGTAHLGQRVAVEAEKAHLDDRVPVEVEKAHLRERVAPSAHLGWPCPPRHLNTQSGRCPHAQNLNNQSGRCPHAQNRRSFLSHTCQGPAPRSSAADGLPTRELAQHSAIL